MWKSHLEVLLNTRFAPPPLSRLKAGGPSGLVVTRAVLSYSLGGNELELPVSRAHTCVLWWRLALDNQETVRIDTIGRDSTFPII